VVSTIVVLWSIMRTVIIIMQACYLRVPRMPWHIQNCLNMGKNWVFSQLYRRLEKFGTLI